MRENLNFNFYHVSLKHENTKLNHLRIVHVNDKSKLKINFNFKEIYIEEIYNICIKNQINHLLIDLGLFDLQFHFPQGNYLLQFRLLELLLYFLQNS